MSQEQQADGYYPRLNGQSLQNPQHLGGIVSLIGTIASSDGSSISLRCADGGMARVEVPPDFAVTVGSTIEVIGALNEDRSVNLFVSRDMGQDFDAGNYNRTINNITSSPKYAELFCP